MKKLALALVLVGACHSGGTKRPGPVRPAGAPFASGSGGATSPRAALGAFLAAAKHEDLQAMASVWGTAAGPERNTIPRDELEKRELILICFLRHDRYQIVSEAGSTAGQRRLEVEIEYRSLRRTTAFTVVPAADGRWYVLTFDVDPLREICAQR